MVHERHDREKQSGPPESVYGTGAVRMRDGRPDATSTGVAPEQCSVQTPGRRGLRPCLACKRSVTRRSRAMIFSRRRASSSSLHGSSSSSLPAALAAAEEVASDSSEACVPHETGSLPSPSTQSSSAEHESAGQLGSVAAQCVAGGDSPIVVKIGLGSSGRTAQAHLPLSKLDRREQTTFCSRKKSNSYCSPFFS